MQEGRPLPLPLDPATRHVVLEFHAPIYRVRHAAGRPPVAYRMHRTSPEPSMKTLRPVLASLAAVLSIASPAAAQKDSTAVESRNGLVVSVSAPASDIGAAILSRGGN